MLQDQTITFNFSQGLNLKDDPWQVPVGQFLSLKNSVFTTGGRLTKRNGFAELTTIDADLNYITSLNDNLTAIGSSVYSLDDTTLKWTQKGTYVPIELSTLSLVKNAYNQAQADSSVLNGLVCTVYTDSAGSGNSYFFVVADATTGQNIIPPTPLPTASGAVSGSPRIFALSNYWIVVYPRLLAGATNLLYIAIPSLNPTATGFATNTIGVTVTVTTNPNWDGVVVGDSLYVGYNTLSGGQSIKVTELPLNSAILGNASNAPVTFSGYAATIMSLCADTTTSFPYIYVSFYSSASSTGYTLAVSTALVTLLAPTEIIASGAQNNITSVAQNAVCTVFYETVNAYGYDSSVPTDYINQVTITSTGTVSTPFIMVRSVGLASKAFTIDGIYYFLAAYESSAASGAGFQPTYFVINGTTSVETAPIVALKLAYSNGGGYLTLGLPSVTVDATTARLAYLYKDLLETQAPTAPDSAGLVDPALYTQTGINLANVTFASNAIDSVEIANGLQISGGFGWLYDGLFPVEENFFLWPDSVEVTTSSTGGNIVGQPSGYVSGQPIYYIQAIYSWTDNQGLVYNSAPSIPVAITGLSNVNTYTFTYYVPTLRLTYKVESPIRIRVYRWSVLNQNYYEVTSITNPTYNNLSVDYVTITDTLADASIVGNNLIYTTGGVVEDVNSPASSIMTLFDTRVWKVDAEDPNLLWESKQIIPGVPVEWSDLLTYYVAPSLGTTLNTGPMKALAPMDDKLIIFKSDSIFFINGTGPDNTGANSQYPTSPYFVTSTVGCTNQQSIVLMQDGLMFQTDKGIWLLGRDLSTVYIGAPVEAFNSSTVTSAVNVPATTQVRFALGTGEVLMFDYFYKQWGEFEGIPATSSCIVDGLHTFLNQFGEVYQESPGLYQDGDQPVLMSFLTSWINLGAIQGYERFYDFYLLANYLSPHNLLCQVAYDYNPSPLNSTLLAPQNFSSSVPSPFGVPTPFGAPIQLEQWRVHAKKQLCQSFQLSVQEVFDPSKGTVPGAGFTMTGISCNVALKKTTRPIRAANASGLS